MCTDTKRVLTTNNRTAHILVLPFPHRSWSSPAISPCICKWQPKFYSTFVVCNAFQMLARLHTCRVYCIYFAILYSNKIFILLFFLLCFYSVHCLHYFTGKNLRKYYDRKIVEIRCAWKMNAHG